MSDPFATTRVGQSLLNAELINGLSAKDAELHALKMASIRSGSSGSTSDLKKKVQDLEAERNRIANSLRIANGSAQSSIDALRASEATLEEARVAIRERDAALIERDALIKEWMLQAEACKRIAKTYAKVQGLSIEKVREDFQNEVINITEEDPSYEVTDVSKRARSSKVKG